MPNITFQGPWEDEDKQRVSSALALLLEAYPDDSIVCYRRISGNAMPYAADVEQQGRTQHAKILFDFLKRNEDSIENNAETKGSNE